MSAVTGSGTNLEILSINVATLASCAAVSEAVFASFWTQLALICIWITIVHFGTFYFAFSSTNKCKVGGFTSLYARWWEIVPEKSFWECRARNNALSIKHIKIRLTSCAVKLSYTWNTWAGTSLTSVFSQIFEVPELTNVWTGLWRLVGEVGSGAIYIIIKCFT